MISSVKLSFVGIRKTIWWDEPEKEIGLNDYRRRLSHQALNNKLLFSVSVLHCWRGREEKGSIRDFLIVYAKGVSLEFPNLSIAYLLR